MSEPYDVLTMGRIGVDVYPMQVGVPLEDVETFGKWLGGTATNVAVAAARHGRRTAVVSRVGADPFGTFVHKALRGYGVDDRYVTAVPGLPTPVTFCEIFPPDDFPIYFYRYPKAPDLEIHPLELDLDAIDAAGIFWVTGTGLCAEPSRSATLAALEHRNRRGITVLDLDYRPMFWESREEAREQMQRALPHVTVAVGNLDECHTAVGTRDPIEAAARLREAGVRLAVVKRGPEGVLAVDDERTVTIPPMPTEVVNGLGAGDAFGGALCHGLLSDWPTEKTMRFANTAGAIVASRLACSDAMPTTQEVEKLREATPVRPAPAPRLGPAQSAGPKRGAEGGSEPQAGGGREPDHTPAGERDAVAGREARAGGEAGSEPQAEARRELGHTPAGERGGREGGRR